MSNDTKQDKRITNISLFFTGITAILSLVALIFQMAMAGKERADQYTNMIRQKQVDQSGQLISDAWTMTSQINDLLYFSPVSDSAEIDEMALEAFDKLEVIQHRFMQASPTLPDTVLQSFVRLHSFASEFYISYREDHVKAIQDHKKDEVAEKLNGHLSEILQATRYSLGTRQLNKHTLELMRKLE